MRVEVYVAGVAREVWFRGSRDERQVTVLNCLDRQAHKGLKLKQTFDYTPTPDEVEALGFPGGQIKLKVPWRGKLCRQVISLLPLHEHRMSGLRIHEITSRRVEHDELT